MGNVGIICWVKIGILSGVGKGGDVWYFLYGEVCFDWIEGFGSIVKFSVFRFRLFNFW